MNKIRNIQQPKFLNVLTKGSEWNITALLSCCTTCTQCPPFDHQVVQKLYYCNIKLWLYDYRHKMMQTD